MEITENYLYIRLSIETNVVFTTNIISALVIINIYAYTLLIRGFSCFVFNFCCTKIPSYKFRNNIPFSLIFFFPTKNVKFVILFHVQKEKKKLLFSPPICIQMSNTYLYLLSI